MELILFGFSFFFSLVLLIMGFWKESAPLALIGSLVFMITSIMLMATGLQTTFIDLKSDDTVSETTLTIGEETNFPVGMMFFMFSLMIFLYSGRLILYGRMGA